MFLVRVNSGSTTWVNVIHLELFALEANSETHIENINLCTFQSGY